MHGAEFLVSRIAADRDGAEKEVEFRGNRYIIPTTDITIAPSLLSGEFESFEIDLFDFDPLAFLDDVFLTLEPELTRLLGPCLALAGDVVGESDGLGAQGTDCGAGISGIAGVNGDPCGA